MIVEQRIYTLHPGKVAEMVKLYGEEGLPLQQAYLGKFIGYFTAESGNLNQVVFMWGFDSLDDRAARRDRMARDPKWQAYLEKVQPLLVSQENRILKPTAFSPIR
ncbi:MAG TPA: NIPSNAP family protein [Burkholderiales bacterium]|nr:NIPSNAP family protein [Burkholderiales bacterium]